MKTLRGRVLVYLALASIASCALTVGVGVVLVRHRVAAQRAATLESQANTVAADSLASGEIVYAISNSRARRLGPVRSALVLDAIPQSGDAEGTITVDRHSLLYAARDSAAGRIVLVRSANLAFAEWRPFLGSLILAGLGGALGINALGLDSSFPIEYLVFFLIVVSIGGTGGSVKGALAASLLLGLADEAGKYYVPETGAFIIYVVMLLVMLWRPNGLFGRSA